jgi:hypothetical protein
MKFTSLPRGVFNFGIASKGLYRKVEYYDETNDIIIDSNLVLQSDINKAPYYNFKGNKLYLRKQQEGTFLVEKNCKDVKIEYSETNELFLPFKDGKIYNGCGFEVDKVKGIYAKLKYATTTKKVYMYREKLGGGISPFVDLFIVVGGLGDLNTENMLAKNLPTFIVADILEKAGVKVRIYGLRTYKDAVLKSNRRAYEDDTKTVFIAYAIKEYGEKIDFGRLASFTSDKRFFRVNMWRIGSALRKMSTGNYEDGKGISLYGGTDDLYNSFTMFKNCFY